MNDGNSQNEISEPLISMEEIKSDSTPQHRLISVESDAVLSKPVKSKRVASLDIFRGLTVALMILVDDAGGDWPMIGHAPWYGCNLADFVMPFFLFIVGMAIALALKRIPNQLMAIEKVTLRTLKLLFWGLLLQGGYSHAPDKLTYGVDMRKIRLCGILQRIALAYLVVALVEVLSRKTQASGQPFNHFSIFKSYFWNWLVGACILIVYSALLYGTYIPDWQFTVTDSESVHYGRNFTVACGVRGSLDPPCNAVGYIDRKVLGIRHMYAHPAWRRSEACTENSPYAGPFRDNAPSWCFAPFEPEGILSSISAILSSIIGVHFGHVLIHFQDHSARLKQWVTMGFTLLILGLVLHFTHAIPLNKQLYTFSYVCVTSGAAALVFSVFYALVDIWGLRYLFLPLEWIGMNAMLVYVMAAAGIFAGFINGWYYEDPHNTLIYWIKKHVFIGVWHSKKVGILLYVIFAEILFWGLVSGILHRFGLYWKL
ncbi:heparan-alpha-glucosaminide N-acetyltransferase isoform X1 [Cucurbita pepo subsp. pepo]|uniref:heparan-alpha-glucosaminide N-acetyltransferase isoform X1 n=3 Tax=Cucurbita pepo subsp. pepo TaxID=3664 RepID=UPI000C9D4ADF|nr:heparan-alpha-glucosaminide N-acetyltransferase isoform X1 [Cucurbita pepo subsp. pepo]